MSEPTKGFRVVGLGCASYIADVTAGKAKMQLVGHAREFGWCLPSNPWADITSCTRWKDGDGRAAGCYVVKDIDRFGVETRGDWWSTVLLTPTPSAGDEREGATTK